MVDVSPTLRRRELGVRLRELRTQAGMTVEDVAARLLCSASKISRMETGQRAASLRDVRDLCGIYGVNDLNEQEHLMSLARATKERGWWHDYELRGLATYVGLEGEASSISIYHTSIVPALLQTEEYARAVLKGTAPELTGDMVNYRVQARLIRQRRLTEPRPAQLAAILDEAALRRHVGSPETMRDQLGKIVEAAIAPNVTVQVIPYEAGAHPGMNSMFCLLEFDDPPIPGIVYVEGLVGQLYLERETDLAKYHAAFEYMRSTVALAPEISLNFIEGVRREWG